MTAIENSGEDLSYLKQVSRVKHKILSDYLGPWATILGRGYPRLRYVDCFAGRGAYVDEDGKLLPGSPLIALQQAKRYVQDHPGRSLSLGFVEKNRTAAEQLRAQIEGMGELPSSVHYYVEEEEAQNYIEALIAGIRGSRTSHTVPTFFFVDPYGHPISVPVMRQLLRFAKTEILVNLMWFRIAMDLQNPKVAARLDKLFGHAQWRSQAFMRLDGRDKEREFIRYFSEQAGSPFHLEFAVPFSPEDNVAGGEHRVKYYLIHFSSNIKEALLMKSVMWSARQDLNRILLGPQLLLFGEEHDSMELGGLLLERFSGRELSFDEIQVRTLDWPYLERHYREALKAMEGGRVIVRRLVSKKRGLRGHDRIVFV